MHVQLIGISPTYHLFSKMYVIDYEITLIIASKGPSTNRFRPPIADLFREVVNPLPPLIADQHMKVLIVY